MCRRAKLLRAAWLSALTLASACVDVRAPAAPSRSAPSHLSTGDGVGGDVEEGDAEAEPALSAPATTASPASLPASGEAASFRAPIPALGAQSPARLRAELSDDACLRQIKQQQLPFEPASAAGVDAPMRLTGTLHGVRFVVPPASSPHGVLDCRLALALSDLALLLETFDVVEVKIDNFYRQNAVLPKGAKQGKQAKRRSKPSQHARALAADITSFKLADGRVLTIPRDWHAPIGSTSCGPEARLDEPSADATLLRDLVCEVARKGLFHRVLTPSYNAAHQGHFHFDLGRGDTTATIR